jgi:hypothetical protein
MQVRVLPLSLQPFMHSCSGRGEEGDKVGIVAVVVWVGLCMDGCIGAPPPPSDCLLDLPLV